MKGFILTFLLISSCFATITLPYQTGFEEPSFPPPGWTEFFKLNLGFDSSWTRSGIDGFENNYAHGYLYIHGGFGFPWGNDARLVSDQFYVNSGDILKISQWWRASQDPCTHYYVGLMLNNNEIWHYQPQFPPPATWTNTVMTSIPLPESGYCQVFWEIEIYTGGPQSTVHMDLDAITIKKAMPLRNNIEATSLGKLKCSFE
jgi:hypothetical protein